MSPLHGQKLIYLTPGGGFSFIFTLALYFGVLLTIPIAVYHLYRFLQPLLKEPSRKLILSVMVISSLLAVGGAAFGYFVTVPAALSFLATFAGDAVIPSLTADSYLNFVVAYVLGLAILFQLPLLLFLFDHIRPFPPGSLLSTQRFVIIGAVVVAAIITPTPDAFNMAIVAVPIVAIYQLGAIAVFIRHRIQRTRRTVQPAPTTTPAIEDDEPLTAIIEDLQAAATPIAPQPSSPPQPQMQRTIDGFGRPRPQTATIRVPSRPTISDQPSPSYRQVSSRSMRSMDGFLRASS